MREKLVLGDLLQAARRPVDLGDGEEVYPLVGVRLWGKGAFLRERKPGCEIKKKRHFRIEAGDIFYNKLFAWRGSFAVAGQEVDGCFGSDKFPAYTLKSQNVLPEWLNLIFASKAFAKEAEQRSVGSAAVSKFTLNPSKFLELPIFVPDLALQRQCVIKMREIDRNLAFINDAADGFLSHASKLVSASFEEITRNIAKKRMGDVGHLERRSITIRDDTLYRQITIAMNNRGIRLRGEKIGTDIAVKNQATVCAGDVVFSRIDIRNGAIGIVPKHLDGATVANDFPAYVFDAEVHPEYANFAFSTRDFRTQCIAKSAGSTGRKKMRRNSFLELDIPLPPLEEQMRVLDHVRRIREWVVPVVDEVQQLGSTHAALRDRILNEIYRPSE